MTSPVNDFQPTTPEDNLNASHKSKRFRFKKKTHHPDNRKKDENRSNRQGRHHHHDGHHRSKRRKTSSQPLDDPSVYDDTVSDLPPDAAFRESLFDAMGDDEGADFWQGVYGQPIHNYPNIYRDQETGELEHMDDEEYAQFVRRKMWEKSWEGIEAAREEKRRQREQEKQKIHEKERTSSRREIPQQDTDYLFDLDIDRSIRRGERRRDRRRWKTLWDEYLQSWKDLSALRDTRESDDKEQLFLRNKIAWPVESGKRKDVNAEEIDRFLKHCSKATDDDDATLIATLKTERIRWHPDKIQQRFGFMRIDEGTMQGVTAVFQTIDQMWNDRRKG